MNAADARGRIFVRTAAAVHFMTVSPHGIAVTRVKTSKPGLMHLVCCLLSKAF
jgi:hypothetical protein